jgi:hypothetical protein
MLSLLLFIAAGTAPVEQPVLARIIYDIQIVDSAESRVHQAKLALHHRDDGHFSLHCRKDGAGTMFTYWATDHANVLSIPREKVVFEGKADQAFRLFPNGPSMSRQEWLDLLREGRWQEQPGWQIDVLDGWFTLYDDDLSWQIRWREREQDTVTRYSARVLEPMVDEDHAREPLNKLTTYWNN